MKKPYLSIIIPAYNSEQTLKSLLDSIYSSTFADFEVILVDDSSADFTGEIARTYKNSHRNFFYLQLKKKSGVSVARNRGANYAHGKILTFADSDIVLYPKTLSYLVETFKKKKVDVVIGTLDKIPANNNSSLFQQFKALNYYSYWVIERDKSLPIGGFGGALGSIKRDLFRKVGGFNENYREMEDQEMGWRLIKMTEIYFNPKIRVKHYFAGFFTTFKKFYLRSYQWMKIFKRYKEFFGPGLNPREAFIAGLANLSLFLLVLSLFLSFVWVIFATVFALRLFLGRKFILFAINEKGLIFFPVLLFFSHALYLAVYLGVACYFLETLVRKW